jgi:1,4-dihydroxy-2-naphthoate polyprenyltransferase
MKIWIQASRLRTLPAALCPVLIGCSLAADAGSFHALAAMAALGGAILIQIATNFANDYFDFINGVDNETRIGPARATQSGAVKPAAMKLAFIATFAMLIPVVTYLAYRGGWPIAILGAVSVAAGILYTGGPKPLGYLGLGDVLVLVFFGPIAVGGTHYVQALELPVESLVAGIGPGLLSTAILVVNNLRDMDADRKTGKNTLAVRFGPRFARAEYAGCIAGAAATALWFGATGRPWVYLAALSTIASWPMLRSMWAESGADLDKNLGRTGKLLVLYSVLFSAGWAL